MSMVCDVTKFVSKFHTNYARKGVLFMENLHKWKKNHTTAGRDARTKFHLCLDILTKSVRMSLMAFIFKSNYILDVVGLGGG